MKRRWLVWNGPRDCSVIARPGPARAVRGACVNAMQMVVMSKRSNRMGAWKPGAVPRGSRGRLDDPNRAMGEPDAVPRGRDSMIRAAPRDSGRWTCVVYTAKQARLASSDLTSADFALRQRAARRAQGCSAAQRVGRGGVRAPTVVGPPGTHLVRRRVAPERASRGVPRALGSRATRSQHHARVLALDFADIGAAPRPSRNRRRAVLAPRP